MKKARTDESFTLPRRQSGQTFQGFVRKHLKEFERALFEGVRYEFLAKAVRAAGFGERTVVSLRVAVHRARRRALACTPTQSKQITQSNQTPAPTTAQVTQHVKQSSQPSSDDDVAVLARRFKELCRPPRPGDDDPLI